MLAKITGALDYLNVSSLSEEERVTAGTGFAPFPSARFACVCAGRDIQFFFSIKSVSL